MKICIIKFIKFYQKFLSPIFPNKCRFYPSCSEYGLWAFGNKNFFIAFIDTFLRILRCNPFFKGGFDYPTKKNISYSSLINTTHFKPNFWLIPNKEKNNFYIVKSIF